MSEYIYIGIDVGKYSSNCSAPGRKPLQFSNDRDGIADLLKQLAKIAAPQQLFFVMESTGGYSSVTALLLLAAAECQVAIVPPLCIRGFIQSKIRRTKNDKCDALAIRLFAEACHPAPWTPPSVVQRRLRDLQLMLTNVSGTLVRLKCLREKLALDPNVDEQAWDSLQRLLQHSETERQSLQASIETLIASDPELHEVSTNMQSIPGVGPGVRNVLLAVCYRQLLELPQRKLLAYCGLSPQEHQSGQAKGHTTMNKAGDARIRKLLYMVALHAVSSQGLLHSYFQRQKAAGRPGKTIMVGVMRKMLYLIQGVIKSGVPFDRQRFAASA